MNPKTHSLNKSQRLKSRKTIDALFKAGKSFSVFPFRVLYLMLDESMAPLQAGFSAPTKNFKKAVDRNRIKRLIKESYRLHRHLLEKVVLEKGIKLSVFFIYTGKELPDQELVTNKISVILQLLIKKLHESGPSNT